MNIADIIASLVGGANPNQAIMDANGALPPSGTVPQQAPMPIPDATPTGMATPVTNPAPAQQVPKAMQSPPDLANMYIELMKRNQNAQQLDSGLSMIAAGLSKYPENRAALLASGGKSAGGMSLSGADIVNMQKQQTEMQNALVRKTMLGSLAKQYNMTPQQIGYLEASGKLDEVIKHYSTENLATVEDRSNGQTILFAPRSGKEIARLGGEKPDETTEITRPDGSKYLAKKETGEPIRELAPAAKAGDVIDPLENQLAAINKEKLAKGETPMTMPELIKLKQSPGVQVHVSPTGAVFNKPPEGQDYVRNPDGTVKVDADGKPTLYDIAGSAAKREAEAAAKKLSDEEIKKAKTKVQATFAASNVGLAIDEALKHVDTPGVVGIGSKAIRGVPSPGGLPHDKFDAAMSTISANVAFEALRQMRASSPTGGALGQVSDFENRMLRDTIAPLASYQDPKTMRAGLNRIKAAMEILADDNFGNDPEKFKAALDKRTGELATSQAPKAKANAPKIEKLN